MLETLSETKVQKKRTSDTKYDFEDGKITKFEEYLRLQLFRFNVHIYIL